MKITLLVSAFLISCFAFSAPGDDCATSILVSSNACSTASQYSNAGITGTVIPTCFGTGTNNSMWFSFLATAPTVNITVTGSSLTQTMVALLGSPPTPPCTGTFPELACSNPATGAVSTVNYSALTVGSLYYIIVDGKNSLTGTFQLCVTSLSQPSNDDPCSAITLPASNFCSAVDAYSNAGATGENLTSVSMPSCMETTSLNTVYFKFTAIGTNNTILINGSATGLNRPQAFVFSTTSCSGTTYSSLACSQAASGANTLTLTANNLNPGDTYYILVDGFSSNTGAFQICVNSFAPTITVVNDECSTATVMCPNNQYFATTKGASRNTSKDPIASATSAGTTGEWQCNGVTDNTVWFSFFTTSPASDIKFSINSNCIDLGPGTYTNGGALQFEVFKRMGALSACADRVSMTANTTWDSQGCTSVGPGVASGTLTIAGSTLLPNTQYFLIIDNYPDCGCDFNFIISGNQGVEAGADESKCLNAAAYTLPLFSPSGGTWSGPGITNATTGTFTPSSAGIGTHTLYYTQGGCTDSKVVTVTAPVVTVSNDVTICSGVSTTLTGSVSGMSIRPITATNSTPYSIYDNGITSSSWTGTTGTFASSAITPVGLMTGYSLTSVVLNITHTYDADLIVWLTNSSNQSIKLIDQNGLSGNDFTNTTFTPSGGGLLTSGTAPFTGTFIPAAGAAAWATFIASCTSTTGAWTLKVGDLFSGDVGTIVSWTLNFTSTIPDPTYAWTSLPVTTINSNTSSLTQTVTPSASTAYTLTGTDYFGCTNTDVVNVTVSSGITPTFAPIAFCSGTTAPTLPSSSTNTPPITGTWTPPTINNTTAAPYTFAPDAGQCAVSTTLTTTISTSITPTFTPIPAFCSGTAAPSLPSSSTNTPPITGTWLPPTIDNTTGAPYAFTPDPNQCGASTSLSVTVNPSVTASVSIAASSTNACPGVTLVFTATPTNGGTTPTYQWKVNSVDVGIGLTYSSSALNAGDIVEVVMTSDAACVVSSPATSNQLTITASTVTPTVSIVPDINPACAGTNVTFTATPVNGGSAPVYQWMVNGTNVGTGLVTYSSTVFANNDIVTVEMTSNAGCLTSATATSAPITMTINPSVTASVTIAPDLNSVCAGTNITFTATPVNGGATPVYQWKVNGNNVGTGLVTYSSTAFANNDVVTVVMTSNEPCVISSPATSLGVTMIISSGVTASVTISPDANPVCVGTNVTFTAVPVNGGTTPVYQWKVNNIDVVGANSVTYSSTAFANNDVVTVVLTNNAACVSGSPATSLGVTMIINSSVNASVSISESVNSICPGTNVVFTAVALNGGTTPIYQWKVNNIVVGTNSPTYSSTTFANNDPVICIMTSNANCVAGSPATSNSVVMIVNSGVTASVTISPNVTPICPGTNVVFTAIALNGGTTPVYQWKVNNVVVGTNSTSYSSSTFANGDAVICIMTSDANCVLGSPATSTIFSMVVNPFPVINVNSPTICNGDLVSLIATGATTWSWSPGGSTSSTIPVSPIISTTYSVTGTSSGCSTTVTSNVTVNQPVSPTFLQLGPICQNDISPTLNTSSLDVPQITGTWSPSTISNTTSASYTFTPTAGLCAINKTMNIVVNPLPSLIVISPNAVCQPNRVDITDASLVSGNDLSDKLTYFGNANCTLTLKTPTSIADSGTYYIKSTSSLGCKIVLPIEVVINKKPIADFTPTPSSVTTIVPVSTMINTSTHATFYDWVFSDNSISEDVSPEHIFPDSAYSDQLVILIAISDKGCSDTTSKTVIVNEELVYYIPNSFTPDEDNFNPIFKPVFTAGYDPYNFSMYIYNRWGQLVFESHDPQVGWDGKYGKDGVVVVESVYTWKIDYKLKGIDKRQVVTGHVNVLK